MICFYIFKLSLTTFICFHDLMMTQHLIGICKDNCAALDKDNKGFLYCEFQNHSLCIWTHGNRAFIVFKPSLELQFSK